MCTYVAAQWAVYVQLREEKAIRLFELGEEIERRCGRALPYHSTYIRKCVYVCACMKYLPGLALHADTWICEQIHYVS
jgi:hypothetical protein